MKKVFLIAFISLAFALGIIGSSTNVRALAVNNACSDIDIIFARGSGQDLQGDEARRFITQIKSRLDEEVISDASYELGTESYENSKYQAVDVGKWWENGNAVGASLSAGIGNDYGKSVNSGTAELQSYLNQRLDSPDIPICRPHLDIR